jgi:hypothetical protein
MPKGPAAAVERQIRIVPRSLGQELQYRSFALPTGETAIVVTSGVILNVISSGEAVGVLDIEADQLVGWTHGNSQQMVAGMQAGQNLKDDQAEFYLAGHVEIRTQTKTDARTLRCDEAYYDVKRHVAVALKADLQITPPTTAGLRDDVHLDADTLLQLNENLFQARIARVSASALPYNPGLAVRAQEANFEARPVQRRTIFGLPVIDLKTGLPLTETQHYFSSRNVFLDLEGVPIFYTPVLKGDVQHPLGPLESIGANYNHIFGFQLFTTWDVYQLIGITRIPDTRWQLDLDYLTARGPAVGSKYEFANKDFLGIPGRYTGEIKGYGIYDHGTDVVGPLPNDTVLVSNPPPVFDDIGHPTFRGRFFAKFNGQDMPDGFMVQGQISAQSDANFLRQYYQSEFQSDPNQETFVYLKQQQDWWAWTILAEPNIRNWVTETEWLPRLDGYGLGIKLLDHFTYNVKGDAAYARLRTTDVPPFPVDATDTPTNTGRFDLWQDVSLPFQAGAFKIVPYAVLDLTYYSQDLEDQQVGRVYGGGGVRASFPLSRLYPDIHSELFNLDGIYHKIVVTGNFYDAFSNISFTDLPQLDRLNDDIGDLSLRTMTPWQITFNPANAVSLTTSPIFNPQDFALRQLVLDKIDTRDSIEVVQFDVFQRWQTKRGFPGNEHVVDWMTLDLNASLYPRKDRDNPGSVVGFLEYDWLWNIGDRTSLVSSGWADPVSGGPRVFEVGANVNRPDNTSFYVGYRQLDPLQSKSVLGSVTFAFSPKYAMTASINEDFGIHTQTYSVLFTRIGTDVQVSLGVNFNSILHTFGFVFEVLPTLVANRLHAPLGSGMGLAGGGAAGR